MKPEAKNSTRKNVESYLRMFISAHCALMIGDRQLASGSQIENRRSQITDPAYRRVFELDSNPARTAVNRVFSRTQGHQTRFPLRKPAGRVAAKCPKGAGQLNTYLKKTRPFGSPSFEPDFDFFAHFRSQSSNIHGRARITRYCAMMSTCVSFLYGSKDNQLFRARQAAVESNSARTAVNAHFLSPLSPVGKIGNLPNPTIDPSNYGRNSEHGTFGDRRCRCSHALRSSVSCSSIKGASPTFGQPSFKRGLPTSATRPQVRVFSPLAEASASAKPLRNPYLPGL